jgi:hypothetical protein
MDAANDFNALDAQTAEANFAQFTPHEHWEYGNYLDWVESQNAPREGGE